MNKIIFFIFFLGTNIFADGTSTLRQEYSQKLLNAFELQNAGLSTQAFYTFSDAFQQGIKAGESSSKLQVIADIFYWYRKYGVYGLRRSDQFTFASLAL